MRATVQRSQVEILEGQRFIIGQATEEMPLAGGEPESNAGPRSAFNRPVEPGSHAMLFQGDAQPVTESVAANFSDKMDFAAQGSGGARAVSSAPANGLDPCEDGGSSFAN